MTSMLAKASPAITTMIRMDHTHVLSAFHHFDSRAPARVKKGLADQICLGLEIHAQLEEEIFYPALREVSDDEFVRKAGPEHDEIKGLVARLRTLKPNQPEFDHTVYELMRQVMHHVADEETRLLPQAERLLGSRLSELGARMTRRRLALAGPRAGELAGSMARSMRAGTLLVAAGAALAAGGWLLAHQRQQRRPATRWHRLAARLR